MSLAVTPTILRIDFSRSDPAYGETCAQVQQTHSHKSLTELKAAYLNKKTKLETAILAIESSEEQAKALCMEVTALKEFSGYVKTKKEEKDAIRRQTLLLKITKKEIDNRIKRLKKEGTAYVATAVITDVVSDDDLPAMTERLAIEDSQGHPLRRFPSTTFPTSIPCLASLTSASLRLGTMFPLSTPSFFSALSTL